MKTVRIAIVAATLFGGLTAQAGAMSLGTTVAPMKSVAAMLADPSAGEVTGSLSPTALTPGALAFGTLGRETADVGVDATCRAMAPVADRIDIDFGFVDL